MNKKYLIFTWQPAWVLFQGDSCGFSGAENEGDLTCTKGDGYFKYFLTAGARLVHNRQWELLAARALTGGDITLFIKDPVGTDEQPIKHYGTIPANTEEIFIKKIFCAGEELIIKSASSPASAMFLVREYASGRRGC